jgi:glutathione S-transferase
MPFFAKPIARGLCGKVQETLVDPNLKTASDFMEEHLGRHHWFSGADLTMADFQMSYPIEALLTRAADPGGYPRIRDFRDRVRARPAYQRAEAKGGPAIPSF